MNIKHWGIFATAENITSTSADVSVTTDIQNNMTYIPNASLVHTVLDPSGIEVGTSDPISITVTTGSKDIFKSNINVADPELWKSLGKTGIVLTMVSDNGAREVRIPMP